MKHKRPLYRSLKVLFLYNTSEQDTPRSKNQEIQTTTYTMRNNLHTARWSQNHWYPTKHICISHTSKDTEDLWTLYIILQLS